MNAAISMSLLAGALLLAQAEPAGNETRELFAQERWYKNVAGKEMTFDGDLRRVERPGEVGFGRFNPFRLHLEGGKVREVYVGSRPELLTPYVGQRVRLTGKAVDMEVEGQAHHEIWPARVQRLPPAKTGTKGS